MSKRLPAVELGVKEESGAVDVDEGMPVLNPFERLFGDVWFCVSDANVCANVSSNGEVVCD